MKFVNNEIYEIYLRRRYDLVSRMLKIRGNIQRILDVGCGEGKRSLQFGHECHAYVVACDLIRHSSWKSIKRNGIIDFVLLDINYLPFRENSFDAITMTEVLEHIENDQRCLKSLKTLLRDRGVLIVSTPNGARITSLMAKAKIFLTKLSRKCIGEELGPGDHRREYSPSLLIKLFSKSGFGLRAYAFVSFCPYLPLFSAIPRNTALKLFERLEKICNGTRLAPLFKWCLVAFCEAESETESCAHKGLHL